MLQLVHRELDREAWPTLQLNQSEDKAFHGVASAIACHNLDGQNDGTGCLQTLLAAGLRLLPCCHIAKTSDDSSNCQHV